MPFSLGNVKHFNLTLGNVKLFNNVCEESHPYVFPSAVLCVMLLYEGEH